MRQLSHEDLVNLVSSMHPDTAWCCELEKLGYMHFTGDQNNEDWEWTKSKLSLLEDNQLGDLYQRLQKRKADRGD